MPETTDRLERLEREVRRLHRILLGLALVVPATLAVGATSGTPDEMTLRKLTIVDADGKERIVAATMPDGRATIKHFDRNGRQRIAVVPPNPAPTSRTLPPRCARTTDAKYRFQFTACWNSSSSSPT